MPYDKRKHHRRSIRLRHYDYASPGAYFVTLCIHRGECLLGEVVDDQMQRNEWGQIAHDEWLASAEIRRELRLDAFVVMPNHVHGIVWLTANGAHSRAPLHPPSPEGSSAVGSAHGRAPLHPPSPEGSSAAGSAHGCAPLHPPSPEGSSAAGSAHGRAPLHPPSPEGSSAADSAHGLRPMVADTMPG